MDPIKTLVWAVWSSIAVLVFSYLLYLLLSVLLFGAGGDQLWQPGN